VTRKPSFTPGGSVELGLGDYNARSLKAHFSGPLSDRVAFSVSGSGSTRDGYFTNLANGHGINDRNRLDFRGQLLFQANEDFSLRLIGDTSRIDEACCGVVNILNGPTGALIGAVGGKLYAGDAFDRKAYLTATRPTS
jgi:outer membrane receptor protein involved in Fe transport